MPCIGGSFFGVEEVKEVAGGFAGEHVGAVVFASEDEHGATFDASVNVCGMVECHEVVFPCHNQCRDADGL